MHRIALITLFSLIVTTSQGCMDYEFFRCYVLPQDSHRVIRPNKFEWSYYGIAVDTGSADLCYKISQQAELGAGFAPRGYQVSYTRSDCFYEVALKTQNRQLCDNVITFETNGCVDGSKISKNGCLLAIYQNETSSAPSPEAELILRFLGYSDDKIQRYDSNGEADFHDLYRHEEKEAAFINKLMMLPDFSMSDEVATQQIRVMYPQCTPDNYDNYLCRLINCGLARDYNQKCDSSRK